MPLSVVICDINGLPLINDTLGRSEGEKLLAFAGNLIAGCVRKEDIVAFAREERFLILLPRTGAKECGLIIERIITECADNRKRVGSPCISISAGSATKHRKDEDIEFILRTAEHDLATQKQREHKSFYDSLLKHIKKALYEKSHETEEHGERLVCLSRLLGRALGLSEEQLLKLEVLATLHDIGKVSIDEAVLMKPGALSEEEWKEIKKHPETGYKIASSVPQLKSVANDILSHHERWDGAGYPFGLRGAKIPLLARIVSVVDAFDALTSKRCYRDPVPEQEALLEIERNSGTQFDPYITGVFIKLKRAESSSFTKELG